MAAYLQRFAGLRCRTGRMCVSFASAANGGAQVPSLCTFQFCHTVVATAPLCWSRRRVSRCGIEHDPLMPVAALRAMSSVGGDGSGVSPLNPARQADSSATPAPISRVPAEIAKLIDEKDRLFAEKQGMLADLAELRLEVQCLRAALLDEAPPPGSCRKLFQLLKGTPKNELQADIRRKEDDIRKKEDDIRKKEDDIRIIRQQQTHPSTRTLAQFMQDNRELLSLTCHPAQQRKRVGREGFDLEVAEVVEGLLASPPLEMQQTVSLVLCTASGVGKTFATLSFRHGAQSIGAPFEAVCAYIGLNQSWPLAGGETEFISTAVRVDDVAAEKAVRKVVMQRLLLVLDGVCKTGSLNELDAADHHAQLMPHPSSTVHRPYDFSPVDCGQVQAEILDRLGRLAARESRPLVVLVALDEAQLLDALVPSERDKNSGGARFALRAMRVLQLAVHGTHGSRVLLLPIATGIQAKTSLGTRTNGTNVDVGYLPGAASLTFDDFGVLARLVAKNRRRRTRARGWIATPLCTSLPLTIRA